MGALGNRKPSTDPADLNPVTNAAYPAPNALDTGSPWRTDYVFLTESLQINPAFSVPNYNLTTTKQFSTSSSALIEADKSIYCQEEAVVAAVLVPAEVHPVVAETPAEDKRVISSVRFYTNFDKDKFSKFV